MTSLRSRVKIGLMKKLSLYIFLVLMWCNVGFAEKINFFDIKIGDKISKHFNSQQISKYYKFDTAKPPSGEVLYGKNKKYSLLQLNIEDGIFKKDYQFFQIFYENGTDKIVAIAGVDLMSVKDKDLCFERRKIDVAKYIKKK